MNLKVLVSEDGGKETEIPQLSFSKEVAHFLNRLRACVAGDNVLFRGHVVFCGDPLQIVEEPEISAIRYILTDSAIQPRPLR